MTLVDEVSDMLQQLLDKLKYGLSMPGAAEEVTVEDAIDILRGVLMETFRTTITTLLTISARVDLLAEQRG